MRKRVVIVGGGIGGLATAYNLKTLSPGIEITLVSDRPYFGFTPSYPHLAMGWRKAEEITVPLAPLLPKFGIEFINERAERIDPDSCKVFTESGREIGYDYLVIATGPKLVFGAEGMEHNSVSICTLEHATEAKRKFEEFCRDPGPVVVGAIPGVSCFGPAYEYALMIHHELVKRGLRRKVPITYITSEPFLGHLGLGGVGNSRRLMEDLFAEKDISYITNVKVTGVEKDRVVYEDLGGRSHEIPSRFTMIMPRFAGPDVVVSAGDKVAHPKNGMVTVNRCLQNPTYSNIYGVGVVVFLPPVEKTPVPTGTPKTGQMIEGMARAVALNIVADMSNSRERYAPTFAAICIADSGEEGVGFIANPVIPPREWVKARKGRIVRWAKTAFEKYFLWKIRRGNISPWFEEKFLERVLGIRAVEPCEV
ncbi:MAG: FAD-dependent oxidoreductase [Aquificota bacterium]|nr:FAD-dependent oxidoreductase [Aquificota bacterium]